MPELTPTLIDRLISTTRATLMLAPLIPAERLGVSAVVLRDWLQRGAKGETPYVRLYSKLRKLCPWFPDSFRRMPKLNGSKV